MRTALVGVGIAVVNLPVAGIATFLAMPFWRWFEETTAIESIGHSGPADWCFVAVYALTVATSLGFWATSYFHGRRRTGESAQPDV
jgi:hypothetical protein